MIQIKPGNARLSVEAFGRMADGRDVERYTLTNAQGLRVQFISYGGAVTGIFCPDRAGSMQNIVLAHEDLHAYETESGYLGALIGRYANRIAAGRFALDGQDYTLAINDEPNALHGGPNGFNRQVWKVTPHAEAAQAVLDYTSQAGEEGYPGTLQVRVTYTLTDANEFLLRYQASTDAPTVLNLTNHAYFNLAGAAACIDDQWLMVNADAFTPIDANVIPLQMAEPVSGTPFDFRQEAAFGARLQDPHPQLRLFNGYDHNWVLNKTGDARIPQLAARAHHPASGRVLECLTTEPGVQIYTRALEDGRRDSFTLETQHFPDSPNRPEFPSTVLRPGVPFDSTTIFRFSVRP